MKKKILVFILFLILAIFPVLQITLGDTAVSSVTVANVAPYITRDQGAGTGIYLYVAVGDDDNNYMSLTEDSAVQVTCNATITDANGNGDISGINGTLYAVGTSTHISAEDNNSKYVNASCSLLDGSGTTRGGECQWTVQYYANNATWQCNLSVWDSGDNFNSTYQNRTIAALIAINVDATVDFGNLNAEETAVNRTNMTNTGNVRTGIKIYGYANDAIDSPNAMNCTAGTDKNISLWYMKYNVTDNACTSFSWAANNVNMTNTSNERAWNKTHNFYLFQRQNDEIESRNTTCWALKIPAAGESEVSGTCKGIVSFTACQFDSCAAVLGGGDY